MRLKCFDNIKNEIGRKVIPICFRDERHSNVGTAIPLLIDKKMFLLSAHHVFLGAKDENRYPIQIPTKDNNWYMITQYARRITIPELDVTCIEVPEEFHDHFPTCYEPLLTCSLDITANAKENTSDYYAITGFPVERNRSKDQQGNHVITFESAVFFLDKVTKPEMEMLKNTKFTYANHVAGYYDRKNHQQIIHSDGKRGEAIKPRGMSGGGIWRIQGSPDAQKPYEAKLIGIFTDYLEKEKIVVGTRIKLLTEEMKNAFPYTKSQLP